MTRLPRSVVYKVALPAFRHRLRLTVTRRSHRCSPPRTARSFDRPLARGVWVGAGLRVLSPCSRTSGRGRSPRTVRGSSRRFGAARVRSIPFSGAHSVFRGADGRREPASGKMGAQRGFCRRQKGHLWPHRLPLPAPGSSAETVKLARGLLSPMSQCSCLGPHSSEEGEGGGTKREEGPEWTSSRGHVGTNLATGRHIPVPVALQGAPCRGPVLSSEKKQGPSLSRE